MKNLRWKRHHWLKNVLLIVFALLLTTPAHASKSPPFSIPGTHVIPIQDSRSKGQYELYIKLPEAYDEKTDTKHPVIYFTDAVWHIEILSASTAFLMENAILVGISWQKDSDEVLRKERGEHISRFRDYSVSKSSKPEHQAKYQFGQAAHHLTFIRDDVIPLIEKNYRANPHDRTYFGYSLGGLFGAYILNAKPDTFTHYILGSPSLWRDISYLSDISHLSQLKQDGPHIKVLITHGTLEDKLGKKVEEFVEIMHAKNSQSLAITHMINEGDHGTAFPLTGVRAVTWLANLHKAQDKP